MTWKHTQYLDTYILLLVNAGNYKSLQKWLGFSFIATSMFGPNFCSPVFKVLLSGQPFMCTTYVTTHGLTSTQPTLSMEFTPCSVISYRARIITLLGNPLQMISPQTLVRCPQTVCDLFSLHMYGIDSGQWVHPVPHGD